MTRTDDASRDLVTFGETMLQLAVEDGERLEAAEQLDVRAAGAESNVAIAARRLGATAAWLSKLPDSPLARRVERSLRVEGVDPVVARSEDGRVGTFFIEPGSEPRGTDVVYDRAGAAVRTATPAELRTDLVRDAHCFYTSGITPALSETLANTTESLLRTARDADTRTAFDLNYRRKLWSPADARETCEGLFPLVDTLVVARRDAETVLDRTGDATDVAASLAADFDVDTVVVTRGARGAVACRGGEIVEQPAFEAETVDPIGTGDAFVGGFLARRIAGDAVADALEYGAATAALKRTMEGDAARVTPEEVERVIASGGQSIAR